MMEEEALSSPVYLDENLPLRRLPRAPEMDRPQVFFDRFEHSAVFYDVFRSADGRHVYLIGPMAINLTNAVSKMRITGLTSQKQPRVQVYHGVQAVIARVRLPRTDTRISVEVAGQFHEVDIQPNSSDLFANSRVIFTVNKNNPLDWIADWARFYVVEHGATAAIIYDNSSTDYSVADLYSTLESVEGLEKVLIIPWPYKFGMMDDVYDADDFGGNWAMFAQPPIFTHILRKYVMRARSILNVDIDELVVSPFRYSIFKAVEKSLFGTIRFNRLWVENIRDNVAGPARHSDYFVRKKGTRSKDRGKKWALNPRMAWLGSWRAQPWTHQVKGWLNLSGSSVDFYGYHFIGISNSWYWDRTETPKFDPKSHQKDQLLLRVFADAFGAPRNR